MLQQTPMVAGTKPPLTFNDFKHPKILKLPGADVAADVQVLNYALALEDLESDLYVQAIQRLTTGGVNGVGKTITGLGISEREPDVAYMLRFAPVEAEHRDFIRTSLHEINKALVLSPYHYDFGIENKSRAEVLDFVLTVEATGVAAYLGAVPYLRTRLFTTAAAAIQGTEARHTATLTIIQNLMTGGSKPVAPLAGTNNGIDTPMEPNAVLAMVSPYIVR